MTSHYKHLGIIKNDPWLAPYARQIADRFMRFHDLIFRIEDQYGSLYHFAGQHHYLGLHYDTQAGGWFYREWAPAAEALFLFGDFNSWNRSSHPLQKNEQGIWEIFLDDTIYKGKLKHESLYKVLVHSAVGALERIPAYVRRVVQDEVSKDFAAQVWTPWLEEVQAAQDKLRIKQQLAIEPPVTTGGLVQEISLPPVEIPAYDWEGDSFDATQLKPLLIYECHTGMAQEREGLGTYREFADIVLPRVKAGGYNAIQLMAVHEHPYYGSFGYHVSSFFAPSSRFGTPEDLKYLVKTAHSMGIGVIMDIVHSHAVKNIYEGLNFWDGTDHQYFHGGSRGDHSGWDSKLFNYGKWEVLQFLLSNVRYWLEEFHFDGFRFDGVTSMLYLHHGHTAFNGYPDYFNEAVDRDAITYLQLANVLTHTIRPDAITTAEDVSGMPGIGVSVEEGGIGFDYRLGMGIPDYWIKLLKEYTDEQWNIQDIWYTLQNRRSDEKTIAYCESHDQALVGDKTIAFRLMDKEMYFHMSESDQNLAIDRGIALHKIIRLITIALGGEAYLNFMGNEFGHPEWIDFPREGNGWSYKYARRQWSLADNPALKYKYLLAFDKAMIQLAKEYPLLDKQPSQLLNTDEVNHVLAFAKGGLIFVFNLHPTRAIPDYKFWVPEHGEYLCVLNSDDAVFGGHARIDTSITWFTDERQFLSIYCTNRTVQVFRQKT